MRITGLNIERFGVWRDLALTLPPQGLTVFYGPNETGKTTLMRFIRGVLYGFPPEDQRRITNGPKRGPRSGSLTVEHQRQSLLVRRTGQDDELGKVSLVRSDNGEFTARRLEDVLAGTTEKMFQSVFALGLQELQELATMQDDEVAEQIYALTLGHQGNDLFAAQPKLEAAQNGLLAIEKSSGRLPELVKARATAARRLSDLQSQRRRFRELLREQTLLEQTLAEKRTDLQEVQRRLQNFHFLDRVWKPWHRWRELKREFERLPALRSVTADGLKRLDGWTTQFDGFHRQREALGLQLNELEGVARQLKQAAGHRKHACCLTRLDQQRGDLHEKQLRRNELQKSTVDDERGLKELLEHLGSPWTRERLLLVDDSPEAHARFVREANHFKGIQRQRKLAYRRYRKAQQAVRERETQLRSRLAGLQITGDSLERPLAEHRQRLSQFRELAALQTRQLQLQSSADGLDKRLQALNERDGYPVWVYVMLLLFAICGALLIVAGLATSIGSSALIGAIYMVLGLTAIGTGWAVHLHHEYDLARQVASLREQRRGLFAQCDQAERDVESFVGLARLGSQRAARVDADVLAHAAQRLAVVEGASQEYTRIRSTRRTLSQWRDRLREIQRDYATARNDWVQMLRQVGRPETLNVEDAIRDYQQILSARQLVARVRDQQHELSQLRHTLDQFETQVVQLGRKFEGRSFDGSQPWDALDRWRGELTIARQKRRDYQAQLTSLGERRAQHESLSRSIEELQRQIASLLKDAGVKDRAGYVEALTALARRAEIEQSVGSAEKDYLNQLTAQPDVVITENDLTGYEPKRHQEQMHTLKTSLNAAEKVVQDLAEKLGAVKQELKGLSQDVQATDVRGELQRLDEQLVDGATDWYALGLGAAVMDELRAQFEREHQPEILIAASPYLERLTLGKYRRIWTPLGRRQLSIEDDRGQSLPVELLSGGTREQLFLAVRMAMVKHFQRQGVDLPFVLDDVTVNYDQHRLEAAVGTLLDYARDGQQVLLFTSHLHLAQLFREKGQEPVWLENFRLDAEELAARRAG